MKASVRRRSESAVQDRSFPQGLATEPAPFAYRDHVLKCRGTAMEPIARRFGTPLYVYDWHTVEAAWRGFDEALQARPHLICASVKANGNLTLLRKLARLGSGFDIVSGGELKRVLRAGGKAQSVVFSGVGKTSDEIDAALAAGILLFNVESEAELMLLAERARRKRARARFGIRVNPDVAADTHPHIATGLHRHKFGIEAPQALELYRRARRNRWIEAAGISFHIGSQILDTQPFAEAVARVREMATMLRSEGDPIRYFDVGGGLGIRYSDGQQPPSFDQYARSILQKLEAFEGTLLIEPGRRLFAAAGALLTRVLYVKRNAGRTFVITDAGYNDLIRPVLYSAYHEILPVREREEKETVDVVGPICETADAFARDRELARVQPGDLLAILNAGAYGFVLSSNYNARPRPAEVLIENRKAKLIRRRETIEQMLQAER